jgi:hypothetical protein
MSTEDRPDAEKGPPRKPYHKPKLEVYGSIVEITAHVGNASPHADPPPHVGFKFTTR